MQQSLTRPWCVYSVSLILPLLAAAFLTGASAQSTAETDALIAQAIEFSRQGKYKEAIEPAERAVSIARRALGAEHPSTLLSVNNLAFIYLAQGRFGEAEVLLLQAMATNERVLGTDHPTTVTGVNNLAQLYLQMGRYDEAEPLYKRAVDARERAFGKEDPDTLVCVNNLANLYQQQGRYNEAEPLLKRALKGFERALGGDHPHTISAMSNLAGLYEANGQYTEAEQLSRLALATRQRVLGKDHPDTLVSVNNLAALYRSQGRYGEAEPLNRRNMEDLGRVLGKSHPHALAGKNNLANIYSDQGRYTEAKPLYQEVLETSERLLGPEHPLTLKSINDLAALYSAEGQYSEAELLFQRAVKSRERVLGGEHPDTLQSVNNLAALFQYQERYEDAEPLYKRALDAKEQTLGEEHPDTIAGMNNLALLYQQQGRYDDAEPLFKRALERGERVVGGEHRTTLTNLENLAFLYHAQAREALAEPLHKRVLEARERTLGRQHPDTLQSLNNLATVYLAQARYAEGEVLLRRALEVGERTLGAEHPLKILIGDNLATLYFMQGDWARAAAYWRGSTSAIVQRARRGLDIALTGNKKSEAEQSNWQFWGLVKAVHSLSAIGRVGETEATSEMFQTAQWALGSEAAQSLALMAARTATRDQSLTTVMRERQDLVAEWQRRDALRNEALGAAPNKRHAGAEAENAARIAAIAVRIAEIDRKLAAEFPDYTNLVSPEPISVETVRDLLGANEVLVLFLDTPEWKPASEETFIWVVTKTDIRWVRSHLGKGALIHEVQALRCGLDEEEWATPTSARHCGDLLGLENLPDLSRPLPFHLGKAHALYRALFGQIEDLIAGKSLLIVPSGALTSLPMHVLVTKTPVVQLPEAFEGYKDVAWFGRANAMTTLPAVSSLRALRQHAPNRQAAPDTYAGYGDPQLSGDGSLCRETKVPTRCPEYPVAHQQTAPLAIERATRRGNDGRQGAKPAVTEVFAEGSTPEALLKRVRGLCPLVDTAYEIKCVAERFKRKTPLIRLEGNATEVDIKALSKSGELAQYRVLHFATHGLLSGDVALMTKRQGEPALVLTPPAKPADPNDDGLLMASEVAALKLNADWVVLSACNTAAGDQMGAQALSGLARAFFYAGGRTLLVSHWPVYSDAAVRITTGAFAEIDRSPHVDRAEALQNAMIALMDDPSQTDNAHPAVWAPFVVVGEGAR